MKTLPASEKIRTYPLLSPRWCEKPDPNDWHAVAHDLKTPLQAIGLLAESLSTSKPATGLHQAHRILRCVEEMKRIINRLHETPAEQKQAESTSTRVLEILARVLDICPESEKLTIETALNRHEIPLPEDELVALFMNLITNSSRHGGSNIRISDSSDPGLICIHYSDDGPGMPAGLWPMLEQTEIPWKPNGHGRGLWLIRHMLSRYNGKISPCFLHGRSGLRIELPEPKEDFEKTESHLVYRVAEPLWIRLRSDTHPKDPGD